MCDSVCLLYLLAHAVGPTFAIESAVWCVPALRVPLVHSLINHFRQKHTPWARANLVPRGSFISTMHPSLSPRPTPHNVSVTVFNLFQSLLQSVAVPLPWIQMKLTSCLSTRRQSPVSPEAHQRW